MVETLPFNAGDAGLILLWGTKTPHVTGQLSPPTTTRGAHTQQPKPSVHTHTHTHTHTVKKKKKEEEVGLLMMEERIWNNNEEYVGAPGA